MPPLIKVLLVTMILLNVIFFGWHYYGMDKKQLAPSGDPDVKQLVLLSKPGTVAQENTLMGAPNAEQAPAEAVQTPPAESPLSESPLSDSSLADSRVLSPLSEIVTNRVCLGYSSIKDIDLATDVAMTLARQGYQVHTEFEQKTVKSGYWVMLPPFLNSRSASKAVSILKGRGIKDVAVIGSGELKNAISLGIFTSMETAKRRQKELQKIGYQPLLEERRVDQHLYHVKVMAPGAAALNELLPTEFRKRLGAPATCEFSP